MAICVFGIVLRRWHKPVNCRRHIALAGLVASGACIVAAYLLIIALGPTVNGYEHSLRYTIPFLIAGAPIILSLVYLWAIKRQLFGFQIIFQHNRVTFRSNHSCQFFEVADKSHASGI